MEGSPGTCSVCLERSINTTFLPCQHETVCSFCTTQLDSLCCPVCRTAVSFVLLKGQESDVGNLLSEVTGASDGVIQTKWCLSCVIRYRQEVELYLSKNVFSILFTGFTSRLKELVSRLSVFTQEKEPQSRFLADENLQWVFKPSEVVSRAGESEKLKSSCCPNGCLRRASHYDQQWGFSLACEQRKATKVISGYPCSFSHCQLWELVRRLQGQELLPQLIVLCFCSSSFSSFQQVIDMHNLIYRYKENYGAVGLPAIIWVMLDSKTQKDQGARGDMVSFDVIREEMQRIVPYDRPNAVVKISSDPVTEERDFETFHRITTQLIEAHRHKTPRKWLVGSQSCGRADGLKFFI
ncbi:hypothetical protein Gasu2_45400 [Galdieria sulphuraria]|uniref:RING-type domain-containing protein n=1 Tax=Galdieria sulphuraria TaxID=130081 RepID=M2X5U6_GALSU|nr:uncharacterized protein Gasu_09140 [Galdieria sulphuraria]EME31840.1 hypothetical protein Gasu_09140 [Galdieria sulphuraria]GJD10344.1 hypothetical protein Gasu2_45400 [Galdieria sulphuraria]|eukprot:XP_005708360.1 hypothetical protein Gasu_09140 [Galdieria sulphuraria]